MATKQLCGLLHEILSGRLIKGDLLLLLAVFDLHKHTHVHFNGNGAYSQYFVYVGPAYFFLTV